MRWQDRFRQARAEWMLLTLYERFEQVVMHLLRFDPKATRRLIQDSGRRDLAHLVQHLVV